MSLVVRPQREDFFPGLKRGHGTKRPRQLVFRSEEAAVVVEPRPCAEFTCQLNNPKSSNLHIDAEANARDWCKVHGLSVYDKNDRPNAIHRSPWRAMEEATGLHR